jgi:hypothetical protein
MRRSVTAALFAFLPLIAQEPVDPPKNREPETTEPVKRLLLRAQTLPPEFTSDILLRIADSALVPGAVAKRELIEESFSLAGSAQNPFPRAGGLWTDSQLGMISAAQDLSMDSLSLKTRSVELMLAIDPSRAREMFQSVHLSAWTRLSCKDPLAPVFDAYFRTLQLVFQQSFTKQERDRHDDAAFIADRFRAIDSPLQVRPALKVALDLKSPELLSILAGVLQNISPDARSTMALQTPSDLSPIAKLGSAGMAFLQSFRGFLVSAYGNSRCSSAMDTSAGKEILAGRIPAFNGLARQTEGLNRITREEVQEFTIEESYQEKPFWQSPKSKELLRSLQWLTHGNRPGQVPPKMWTAEERESLEWTSRATDTLKQIDDWKMDQEPTPLDYVYMKCSVYQQLAALAPPGTVRTRAIDHLLVHLASTYSDIDDHVAWFVPVHDLLQVDRVFYGHEMARSPNPVLAAYGELSVLLGPSSKPQ